MCFYIKNEKGTEREERVCVCHIPTLSPLALHTRAHVQLRPAPTVPPMAIGAAKPLGADEETKEQAGAIPHAYAVTVHTSDDENDVVDAGKGPAVVK